MESMKEDFGKSRNFTFKWKWRHSKNSVRKLKQAGKEPGVREKTTFQLCGKQMKRLQKKEF